MPAKRLAAILLVAVSVTASAMSADPTFGTAGLRGLPRGAGIAREPSAGICASLTASTSPLTAPAGTCRWITH